MLREARFDFTKIKCRHIIAVFQGTALRRSLLKTGGIGTKGSADKFKAFADCQVRAYSSNAIWPSKYKLSSRPRLLPEIAGFVSIEGGI
jgi:hypothetical protein